MMFEWGPYEEKERGVMSGMLMWVNAYNLQADHGCDASIDADHDHS